MNVVSHVHQILIHTNLDCVVISFAFRSCFGRVIDIVIANPYAHLAVIFLLSLWFSEYLHIF